MPRHEPYTLRRVDQLRALRSLERTRIVQALSIHGPSSVRDLAGHLGRIPESLYYHVAELVRVGLVRKTGTRPARRRAEAVYEFVGPITIDSRQRSPAFLRALDDVYAASLRATARHLSRSLEDERDRKGERVRQGLVQYTARLSPKTQRELRARLEELIDFVIESDDATQPEITLVTVAYGATPARSSGDS